MQFATVDASGVPGTYTDFSDELAALVIKRSRNTVDRKPTYGDARTIKRAADLVEQVTVNYLGDITAASGFWSMVWEALETAPCNLAFKATYKEGAVSATNPMFTGFVTVVDVEAGAPAAGSNWQSKTWPAFGITGPLSADPDD